MRWSDERISTERREILRRIGAASAMLVLSPALSSEVVGQNKTRDLPRTIEEAGKRFRDGSLGVTEPFVGSKRYTSNLSSPKSAAIAKRLSAVVSIQCACGPSWRWGLVPLPLCCTKAADSPNRPSLSSGKTAMFPPV